MKRTIALLILVLGLGLQGHAADKSATKLIDRYKKASGGSATSRIKSTLLSGTIKTSEGSVGRFTYQASTPSSLRMDIELSNAKESECYNGKSAWKLDARGLRTLLGDEAKRVRLLALLFNIHLNELQKNRIVPQVAGRASVEGRDANAIDFIRDNVRIKLLFDSSTNLLVKMERETSDGPLELFYSDYRLVDGVKEPYSIKIKKPNNEMLISIERVEHNRGVELTAFRYPQSTDARPLPDLETVMKAVIANQEKTDALRERYTCRAVEIERKHDGDGRVKETNTRAYELTPIGRGFVERLMSVNGKDLGTSEREKEDKRVQKEIEEIIKRQEKRQEKKERAEARGESEDDDEVTILDFLRISEITSIRREVFRGHEVIAFDFEPRKGFKAKRRSEEIVNKLAGTIWVDEGARQVARLEARLTDSVKIGGGLLASISPSTAFVFEQEKVGDEIWLPSLVEANVSARLMLFAKLSRSMERRYSDYKKYQVDSKYELKKPKDDR